MTTRTIRVILLQEGKNPGWVAQCLEKDIASQGDSIKDALNNFCEVLAGQIAVDLANKREPLASKKEAPPWYWRALQDAEPLKRSIPVKLSKDARDKFRFHVTSAEAWVH